MTPCEAMNEEAKKKKRSRTNWLFLIANFACIGALFISFLAAVIPPKSMGYLSLFGLAFPFILLSNFAFIIFWYFKRKRFMVLSVIPVILGGGFLTDFFQLNLSQPESIGENELKVLTYNVKLFGVYDNEKSTETRDSIFALLQRENADVICFQEFFHANNKRFFSTRDTLTRILNTKFLHERYTHALHGQKYFGVAMLSRYPIVSRGYIPFENDANNFCIYADIKKGDDTIRVYNAHLQSIRFKPEDYAFVDENKNNEEIKSGSKRIARRLKIAFQKRQEQVDRVAASIEACKYKVILCGDFNDPPVSYTYHRFTEKMEDSFIDAGSGIGNTYIGVFPSFRIDYIMHSKGMKAIEYTTHPEDFSDHHAISATLTY